MAVSNVTGPVTKGARKLLNLKMKPCGAVVLAAGSASRMQGEDKILAPLGGKPLILRTLRAFEECDIISEVVLVTREDKLLELTTLCAGFSKVKAIVAGGADRPESVTRGLDALSEKIRTVAVHDGARPLVTWELIDRVVRAGASYGAAVPAVPVKDTVKEVKGGIVKATPDRSALRAVQTPQAFDRSLLRAALKKARMEKLPITDDASAVEAMGMSVKTVEGDERNLKVTTPMDLKIVRMLAEETV